nr:MULTISPECIES: SdpI family protein [unclassified Clostridium]
MLGYRTPMSMKNKDTWDEAQRYSGLTMIIFGVISLIIGVISYSFRGLLYNESLQLILMLLGAVIMIIFDEIHLWKVFNKDGTRK